MRKAISAIVVALTTGLALPAQSQDTADRSVAIEPTTRMATPAPPTESQRVDAYFKSLVNPFSLLTNGASAAIGQWRGTPKEWGQGGDAYARRFASAFSQHIVYATLLFGGSSLLGDDNRYFPSGESGFGPRVQYAVESTVLARHYDSSGQAHRRFSVSRIGALAGAALISRLWQPRSTSRLRGGAVTCVISLGVAGGFNVAREFLPGFPK